jgi:hypothetical protein
LNPDPKLCGQVFQCGQCEVSVGSEYLLKVHEKTHVTEAKPCNLCGKVVKVRAACFLHISSIFSFGFLRLIFFKILSLYLEARIRICIKVMRNAILVFTSSYSQENMQLRYF